MEKEFLKNISVQKHPQIIILGLDQNFFHDEWNGEEQHFEPIKYYFSIFLSNILNIYEDFFENKINLTKISKSSNIGINAIINDEGFRNDGSYFYGNVILKNESVNERVYLTLKTMNASSGNSYILKKGSISNRSKNDLEIILKYAKENNIYVIGLLPPYAKEVWNVIQTQKQEYAYIFNIYGAIKPIFNKYDFELYDYSDLNVINASNCEIIDGLHASEKAYLRILIDLASKNSNLDNYVNITQLNRKLQLSKGCLTTD